MQMQCYFIDAHAFETTIGRARAVVEGQWPNANRYPMYLNMLFYFIFSVAQVAPVTTDLVLMIDYLWYCNPNVGPALVVTW